MRHEGASVGYVYTIMTTEDFCLRVVTSTIERVNFVLLGTLLS